MYKIKNLMVDETTISSGYEDYCIYVDFEATADTQPITLSFLLSCNPINNNLYELGNVKMFYYDEKDFIHPDEEFNENDDFIDRTITESELEAMEQEFCEYVLNYITSKGTKI